MNVISGKIIRSISYFLNKTEVNDDKGQTGRGAHVRVLIIDDSRSTRIKLRRMIEEIGHQVVGEAENGVEGLRIVEKEKPDAVTLDLVMPKMDGITTLRVINSLRPETRVVVISSAGTLENKIQLRALGVYAFLTKPVQAHILKEALAGLDNLKAVA